MRDDNEWVLLDTSSSPEKAQNDVKNPGIQQKKVLLERELKKEQRKVMKYKEIIEKQQRVIKGYEAILGINTKKSSRPVTSRDLQWSLPST